jgi:excisionase family DNA binding protein
MDQRFLKPAEVADCLKISRSLAYRLIQQGQIRALRIGKTVRVSEVALRDFIAANTAAGSPWVIGDHPFRLDEGTLGLDQGDQHRPNPAPHRVVERRIPR